MGFNWISKLPVSSQKFLLLIISTSEGWKAELTLQPPSGFEDGTPRFGIQRLNHQVITSTFFSNQFQEKYFIRIKQSLIEKNIYFLVISIISPNTTLSTPHTLTNNFDFKPTSHIPPDDRNIKWLVTSTVAAC